MSWKAWFCSNQSCTNNVWMVQRDPTTVDGWWVAAHVEDRPFTVAAAVPVCPRCGRLLHARVEPEAGAASRPAPQWGQMSILLASWRSWMKLGQMSALEVCYGELP